jgi:hypothetical protein
MKLEWLKASVVVTAQEQNPTILHPAFLAAEGIVPPDWELAEDPICTPAFAIVTYRNGITFSVEGSRFQVSDAGLGADLEQSRVGSLAAAYLKRLPHVRYTEVEVRWQAFVEHSDPATLLIQRFLKPGAWNAAPLKLDSLGLRFEYSVDRALLDLFLDAGSVEQDGVDRTGVIVTGSYSSALPGNRALEVLLALLGLGTDWCRHFAKTARTVIGLGD